MSPCDSPTFPLCHLFHIFLGPSHSFSSSFSLSSSFSFSLSLFCLPLPLLFPPTGCYGCLAGSKVIGVPHGCISQYGDLIRCHSGLFGAGDQFTQWSLHGEGDQVPQWSLQGWGAKFHSCLFRVGWPSSTAVASGRGDQVPQLLRTKFHSCLFREGVPSSFYSCLAVHLISKRHSFSTRECRGGGGGVGVWI